MIREYYMRGNVRVAEFVRLLKEGECGCAYDKDPNYFVDGKKLFKKI